MNDWSTHLQTLVAAERKASDALNHKRWAEAWQHLATMRQSVADAENWLKKHHGKRSNDRP